MALYRGENDYSYKNQALEISKMSTISSLKLRLFFIFSVTFYLFFENDCFYFFLFFVSVSL